MVSGVFSLSQTSPLFQTSAEQKEAIRSQLKDWVAGYGKSSAKKPYLLVEDSRVVLFPHAPPTAVVAREVAAPILGDIKAALDSLQQSLSHMDLTLEQMEDLSGKGPQVGDSSNSRAPAPLVDVGSSNPDSFSDLAY